MKNIKKTLVLVIIITFGLSFASCKKCTNCVLKDSSGNTVTTYDEKCDTKTKDIAAYEKACEDQAALIGGTCVCTTK